MIGLAPQAFSRLQSPLDQWQAMPSFVVGEALFIAGALFSLAHARRRGRDHLLIWLAALVAGTANDLIFMALPLVDNFWQAQGTIMLTPRMPLYIPCVYVCFMYVPTVTVRRLGMPRWSGAAATGLLAALFYAPYDIVGAKFLWWTWHDTDQPIASRILGAPCASTLWVLTFAATFAWLIDHTLRKDPQVSPRSFALGFARVAGLTTLLMILQMTALQQVDGGTPGRGALALGVVGYALLALRGRAAIDPRPLDGADRVLRGYVIGYFVVLCGVGLAFSPETHRSTGLHQPTGKCYVEAKDIAGLTRHEFLCVRDFDEDFGVSCVGALPRDGSTWYTICGRPHASFGRFAAGLGGLAATGLSAFVLLLGLAKRAEG